MGIFLSQLSKSKYIKMSITLCISGAGFAGIVFDHILKTILPCDFRQVRFDFGSFFYPKLVFQLRYAFSLSRYDQNIIRV